MDKKYWHRAKPDGSGSGEVVQPKWRKPVRNKFSQSESEMQMWEQELKEETKNWNEHITILPIYAYCDPSNSVGWIEGEEVYQVYINTNFRPDKYEWSNHSKSGYNHFSGKKRIWIEPKREQPHQPDFQREAEGLYPVWHGGFAQQQAHIKARQMSAGEVEELRLELERITGYLEKHVKQLAAKKYHEQGTKSNDNYVLEIVEKKWQQFKTENNIQ